VAQVSRVPGGSGGFVPEPEVDPRAIRVTAPAADLALGLEPIVVEPPPADTGATRAPGVRYERVDAAHGVLIEDDPAVRVQTRIDFIGPAAAVGTGGVVRREVVVDGWLLEVDLESERRAALRARARRGGVAAPDHGPTEVRAIIPGRVLSVSVVAGDPVVAGQQLLAVEAMKMQNELRAPRDGTVERVAVEAGQTIELGDLLLVLA
jgi:biotin carboxyl carrier protein